MGAGADVEAILAFPSGPEELDALVAEGADQIGDEGGRLRGEDLGQVGVVGDLDAGEVDAGALDAVRVLHAGPQVAFLPRQVST